MSLMFRPALALMCACTLAVSGARGQAAARVLSIDDLRSGAPRAVSVSVVRHERRQAVEIRAEGAGPDGESYLTLGGTDIQNGEIRARIAADVLPGSPATVRAFAGIGFRASGGGYEAFYLRMLNGRAENQLQRNHAAQYISHPDHGWARLRRETPGQYESYVDLEPGRWTTVRIVICGANAALYVHGATQPTLTVRDLKRGAQARGTVLLWVGPGTAARFTDVTVHATNDCGSPGAR